jgi:hypothetical protein
MSDRDLTTSDLADTGTAERPSDPATDSDAVKPEASERAEPEATEAADQAESEVTASRSAEARQAVEVDRHSPLFAEEDASSYRGRWQDVQAGFVDQPRQAVEQADALVAELMKRLAKTFADERARLEAQWGEGDDVGTEELRVALQRYRSFFERLLTT